MNNQTADLLESDKNYIMAEWLNSVRSEINVSKNKSDAEIIDHLGSFFNVLISALRASQSSSMLNVNREISKNHGFQRAQFFDYTLEQLLQEFHLLREAVFDYLAIEMDIPITEEDRKIIHSFIDNSVQAAADEFVRAQSQIRDSSFLDKLNSSTVELQRAIESRDESFRTLSLVNRVGQNLTSKLDLDKIVHSVTDAAREITGADLGSFFYTGKDSNGQKVLFYTFSGLAKEVFGNLPYLKLTEEFHPTFAGFGTIRSDDITRDVRFGKNLPYYGLPEEGELALKSYLGVSVISKSGEVLGGIFLGHREAGVFTKQDEEIVEGLAAQAAIAMENGRLYLKLQDAIKDRDTFLSIASHELKTPLTSLTLQSQMRRRQLAKGNMKAFDEKNLMTMFDSDIKQLTSLNRLIDDMLDISRIRTGRLELNKEIFDLCKLAHDVVERFRPQLEEACEKVIFDSCEAAFIEADPYRLEQVIANLLTNAMKYGQGKPLEIKVFSDHINNKAFLCVSDNGMGISEKDQERIFSRFERAVSANEVSGLGLGLAIVKDIIEAHGGEIHLDSEVGVGSTFTIALKLFHRH